MERERRSAIQRTVLIAGVVLASLLAAEVVLTWLLLPDAVDGLLTGIALEFITGRETAFPAALAAGTPPFLVAMASVFQNLAVAALVSPLAIRLLDRWRAHEHFLARRLRRIESSALRHRGFVTTWGPLGLFAFMLVPFLANGALVSLILARVCGIPLRNALAPVAAATVLMSFVWAYALDAVLRWTGRIDSRIPALVATFIAASVVLWAAWDEWRERQSRKREPAER